MSFASRDDALTLFLENLTVRFGSVKMQILKKNIATYSKIFDF